MLGILKAKIAASGKTGAEALAMLTPDKIRNQKGAASNTGGKYTGKKA